MNTFILSLALIAGADVWDSLLKTYVTPEARVDYGRWKKDGTAALDGFLAEGAKPWPASLSPAGQKVALINAYNANMVRWILENYPVESVWRTKRPFTEKRFHVNGIRMSLDDIETRLRAMGDPRIHGALVCAARSCPPLRREAYREELVDGQLGDNVKTWLANPNLNQFSSDVAQVSRIFEWYRKDFEQSTGSVATFLAAHGHAVKGRIQYKTYHWGLNDTTELGSNYTEGQFLLDRVRNAF